MPEIYLELSETQEELLERIRQQEGLDDKNQTAEWLVKQRLKRSSLKLTGRNRALHAVGGIQK